MVFFVLSTIVPERINENNFVLSGLPHLEVRDYFPVLLKTAWFLAESIRQEFAHTSVCSGHRNRIKFVSLEPEKPHSRSVRLGRRACRVCRSKNRPCTRDARDKSFAALWKKLNFTQASCLKIFSRLQARGLRIESA
jgi:hypothetical protein